MPRAFGGGRQGRGPFLIKLAYTEVCQKLGELALRALERDVLTVDGEGPFVEERCERYDEWAQFM